MPAPSILVINGPNLNMLGRREPQIYGKETLGHIQALCEQEASRLSLKIEWMQSNHEGALIEAIHAAMESYVGVIINAGAYTHTSIAIADALSMLKCPIIEVHLSNVFAREAFRHHSYISPLAKGVICGFGAQSYTLAIKAMHAQLSA